MTNFDLLRNQTEVLDRAMRTNKQAEIEKSREERRNNDIVEPFEKDKAMVEELKKKQVIHHKIMEELTSTQKQIVDYDKRTREMEWQYEVRLQQFEYLKSEKQHLFDEFHRLVYEIHQKTGIRNLILEKKYETIQESLETKDAQIN